MKVTLRHLEALRYARDLLLKGGWLQGQLHAPLIFAGDHDAKYCLVGALDRAGENSTQRQDLCFLVGRVSWRDTFRVWAGRDTWAGVLIEWNDHPKRKKEEVIARLDRVIKQVEARV